MNKDFIAKYWYASIYEQFENHTNDVEFLLKVLKEQTVGTQQNKQNILEVACGGGRICVPLAQAGYNVMGFDADEYMLMRCYKRMNGLPNIKCGQADALTADWGGEYDVVVLAGNVLINIETPGNYKEAQELFIRKAAGTLRTGGHLYLDFDLHSDPNSYFSRLGESSYFTGTDDMGTFGRTVSYGSVYDSVTQICAGCNHWELTLNTGEKFTMPFLWHKHIPTQEQVYKWLCEAGFEIEKTYKNFTDEPLEYPIKEHSRATIWARKK